MNKLICAVFAIVIMSRDEIFNKKRVTWPIICCRAVLNKVGPALEQMNSPVDGSEIKKYALHPGFCESEPFAGICVLTSFP